MLFAKGVHRRCFRYVKDTNLKAIHNKRVADIDARWDVSDMSKILIWKQFTTLRDNANKYKGCFRYVKDTNLKAIHNL